MINSSEVKPKEKEKIVRKNIGLDYISRSFKFISRMETKTNTKKFKVIQ